MIRLSNIRNTLYVAGALAFAGCESESDPSGPNNGSGLPALNEILTTAPLNASSSDTLVYFSFVSRGLVAKTADWDLALRRYEVRLNGGISGTKGVLAYGLNNNTTATDVQVLAFTVANTLTAFDAIRDGQIPADNVFATDALAENNLAWASFAGAPAANPASYWKIRTAGGGYALVHITAITYTQTGTLTSIAVESRLQSGATLGSAQSVTVPITGTPVSINLTTNTGVTPSGCNWDLQVNPQTFAITTNVACNVGTFPGGSTPTFASTTSASDAPQYGLFLSAMAGPIPNSVTDTSAPFRYNLQNDNRLSPSFNVFLIKVGTNVYKVQVINYYSDAGASGYPTLRFARIR